MSFAQHLDMNASLHPRGESSCARERVRTTPARLTRDKNRGSRQQVSTRTTRRGAVTPLRRTLGLPPLIDTMKRRSRRDAHSPPRGQGADTPPAARAAAVPTSSCCCPASSQFDGPGIYGGAREPRLLCGARGGTAAPSRHCALAAPLTCALAPQMSADKKEKNYKINSRVFFFTPPNFFCDVQKLLF